MPTDDALFSPDDSDIFQDAPETEESLKAELTEAQKSFRLDRVRERERFVEITDSEFWFCVCFQTRAQKDEFLAKMGLMEIGDKYLDGLAVAEKQGIKLEAPTPSIRKPRLNKRWTDLT